MSVSFVRSDDGSEIWNPGSMTATLFVEQVATIARMLQMESGVGPIAADEVRIDLAPFDAFGHAFAERLLHTPPDGCGFALMAPCFSVVLGLRRRLGLPLPSNDDRFSVWIERATRFVPHTVPPLP
jgi:hypothetical protein